MVKVEQVVILGIVLLAGIMVFKPELLQGIGISFNQTSTAKPIVVTKVVTQTAGNMTTTQTIQEMTEAPVYPLQKVNLLFRDALSGAPVSGIKVEVFDANVSDSIFRDPKREALDVATTDAEGTASFTKGMIDANTQYKFGATSDTIYDVVGTFMPEVRVTSFAVPEVTIKDKVKVYQVGHFNPIGDNIEISLSQVGTSGQYLLTFEINISMPDSDIGKVLKNPVIYIKSPEGKKLEGGEIVGLVMTPKEGKDLGIPATDLKAYVDGNYIALKTSLTDEKGNRYFQVTDSSTYKVTMTLDLSQVGTDDAIIIGLDDLLNGRDIFGGYKAQASEMTISFVE